MSSTGSCAKEPESSTAAFTVLCARHVCLVRLWTSVNVVFCALRLVEGQTCCGPFCLVLLVDSFV